MLSPRVFQTPNAIVTGEAPPFRPDRSSEEQRRPLTKSNFYDADEEEDTSVETSRGSGQETLSATAPTSLAVSHKFGGSCALFLLATLFM